MIYKVARLKNKTEDDASVLIINENG